MRALRERSPDQGRTRLRPGREPGMCPLQSCASFVCLGNAPIQRRPQTSSCLQAPRNPFGCGSSHRESPAVKSQTCLAPSAFSMASWPWDYSFRCPLNRPITLLVRSRIQVDWCQTEKWHDVARKWERHQAMFVELRSLLFVC